MRNLKTRKKLSFQNPDSKLSAIFDINTLLDLEKNSIDNFQLFVCGSKPDISFLEIAEEFEKLGAIEINWTRSERPSMIIDTGPIENVLGYKPSAKGIFNNWIKNESQY